MNDSDWLPKDYNPEGKVPTTKLEVKKMNLSDKEKMIIFNCLKNMGENVTKDYMIMFNFKTGKFFKIKPDTVLNVGLKVLGKELIE